MKNNTTPITREQWLNECKDLILDEIFAPVTKFRKNLNIKVQNVDSQTSFLVTLCNDSAATWTPIDSANASAIAIDSGDGQINVTLVAIGDNYESGYTDFNILVEGENVLNLPTEFILGESFYIGKNDEGYYVNAASIPSDTYSVKIIVKSTIIFDGDVLIS